MLDNIYDFCFAKRGKGLLIKPGVSGTSLFLGVLHLLVWWTPVFLVFLDREAFWVLVWNLKLINCSLLFLDANEVMDNRCSLPITFPVYKICVAICF